MRLYTFHASAHVPPLHDRRKELTDAKETTNDPR
jgi:hypothetical protein